MKPRRDSAGRFVKSSTTKKKKKRKETAAQRRLRLANETPAQKRARIAKERARVAAHKKKTTSILDRALGRKKRRPVPTCAQSYEQFRGSLTWDEAQQAAALRHDRNILERNDYTQPPRRSAILGLMHQAKVDDWNEHQRLCDREYDDEAEALADYYEQKATERDEAHELIDFLENPGPELTAISVGSIHLPAIQIPTLDEIDLAAYEQTKISQALDDKHTRDAARGIAPDQDAIAAHTLRVREIDDWIRSQDWRAWSQEMGYQGPPLGARYPSAASYFTVAKRKKRTRKIKGRVTDPRKTASAPNPSSSSTSRKKTGPRVRDERGDWIPYTGPMYQIAGVPELVITRKMGKGGKVGKAWTITHKPSGMAIPAIFTTRAKALAAVKRARRKVPDVPWRWFEWDLASAWTRAQVTKFAKAVARG